MLSVDVAGRGPRLVLVHGFTQTGRSWAPVIARLESRYELVTVDAPGHGRSAAVRASLWDAGDLIAEAGGRGTYVGYSMGGRLALHAALRAPHSVQRLVLVSATAGIDDSAEREARREADEQLAASIEADGIDAFLDRWLANPLFATLPRDRAGIEARLENTPDGLASSLRLNGTGRQEPLWHRLGSLKMPALFVAGELDERFTALAHRMAAGWGGSSRVAVVAGAGHTVHLEQTDAFVEVLERFLHDTAMPSASSTP